MDLVSSATVTEDRACIQCGYSLRGLAVSGVCPECATPAARSLLGDLLMHSSRQFVARLALGARLIWWSIALTLMSPLLLLLGTALIAVLRTRFAPGGWFLLPLLIFFLLACIAVTGWWLLSSPDPALPEREGALTARRILRGASAAGVVCLLIAALVAGVSAPGAWGRLSSVASVAARVATGAGLCACVVAFVASLVLVRRIALRLPDPWMHRRAGWLLIVSALIVAGLGVSAALEAISAARSARALGIGPAPITVVVGILQLVFVVMYAGLIDRLKAQLTAALRAVDAVISGEAVP